MLHEIQPLALSLLLPLALAAGLGMTAIAFVRVCWKAASEWRAQREIRAGR
jgi:hypothetical protein